MKTTKHYIELFYPGLIMGESIVNEIDHRDPGRIDLDKEEPCRYGGAFAFQFFDQEFIGATDDDGGRFERLHRKRFNETLMYYPCATVLDRDGVEALDDGKDHGILLSNMRSNDYELVVRTCRGNFQSFDPAKQQLL